MSTIFKKLDERILPMVTIIKDEAYYRTSEAAKMAGISRSTLLRWIATGTVDGASCMDRRGWRLFTSKDVEQIREVGCKVLVYEK